MMTTSPFRASVYAGLLLATAPLGGCTGAGAPPQDPTPVAETRLMEPELTALLDAEVLSPAAQKRIRLMDTTSDPLPPRLGRVARDPAAPTFARGNALLLLGEVRDVAQLPAFALAMRSDDPDLRAAAATALEGYLEIAPDQATRLLRRALRDEEPWVQARALQALGPRDAGLLRGYTPLAPNEELRAIARSLLQLAQERGAPLSEEMAAGAAVPRELERRTSSGYVLRFVTERAWETWGAAEGRLELIRPAGDTVRISQDVEVVAGVVPAFFSPDERWLVYEADREIRVRDLRDGGERVVGPGVAPRPLPFTERFVFLRPVGTGTDEEGEDTVEYVIHAAPFAGGEPERLGTTRASVSMRTFGNYAPVRWMRVDQVGDRFFLEAEGMETFRLPDPFGGPASAR